MNGRPRHMLIVTERREDDEKTLRWAVSLAQRQGLRVTVADTLGRMPRASEIGSAKASAVEFGTEYVNRKRRALDRLVKRVRQPGIEVDGLLLTGQSHASLLEEVEATNCDLLVLTVSQAGDFGDRQSDLLWERFAHGCSCPVWARVCGPRIQCERVLAVLGNTSGSADCEPSSFDLRIMDLALSLARWEGATLHALWTWRPPGDQAFRPYGDVTECQMDYLVKQMKGVQAMRFFNTLEPYEGDVEDRNAYFLQGKRLDLICDTVLKNKIDLIVMNADSFFWLSNLFSDNVALPRAVLRRTNASLALVSRRYHCVSERGKARASRQPIERLKALVSNVFARA